MIWNALMFVLWLFLGIAVLVTQHQFPWWYPAVLIFMLALDNLGEAILKALKQW